jgi:hypothetical protein
MDEHSPRSTPLLMSLASSTTNQSSHDKMDFRRMLSGKPPQSQQSPSPVASAVAIGGLSRPRPEIILRWKRFALLVLLGAVLISAVTVTLYIGIPLTRVRPEDAEKKVLLFNSYSGVFMGFIETGVSQLLGYLFPVFIVYLHNLKWSRYDDPATRPISKTKKTALLLFFPIVMIAIGNSLSAVQTNQSGGTDDALNSTAASSKPSRRLLVDEPITPSALLDETLFKSVGARVGAVDRRLGNWQRLASATRVKVGFPLRDWRHEVELVTEGGEVQRGISPETAGDLLRHGLTMFQRLAKDSHVDLALNLEQLKTPSSATPSELLAAVVRVLPSSASTSGFNASSMTLDLSVQQLQPHIQLESLTLELPLTANTPASVVCGHDACLSQSTDPLVRLRSLVAASGFFPASPLNDPNAAFFYSSAVSSNAPAGSTLSLTFAKLSWSFDGASFDLCPERDALAQPCVGLSLPLPRSGRHLILPVALVPSLPSQPQRLVEIVQPPIVTQDQKLASAILMDRPSTNVPAVDTHIDQFAVFLRDHRLVSDRSTMAATLRASALLFLFQHAIVTSAASTPHVAWQRHLTAQATTNATMQYQVFIANTRFGAISTWAACGILFLLTSLVLVLPNARARLEPPKGGNARAERFVAVQTEEVYPNLIYKKRFRIGKTGEKIKFREFAVESVTLHHKMEEDEQIEL